MQIDSFPGAVWFSSYGGRLKAFRGKRGWNGMEEVGGAHLASGDSKDNCMCRFLI